MGLLLDPEGDARSRRESRLRLLTITIGIPSALIFVATQISTCYIENQRKRAFEVERPSESLPRDLPTTRASAAELTNVTTQVCQRLLECGGATPDLVASKLQECVTIHTRGATDAFSRDVLVMAFKRVIAACNAIACEKYSDCYLDAVKQAAGATTSTRALSPAFKAKFVKLWCEVATENPGKFPDLSGPNQSPRMREFNQMVRDAGDVAAIADLMKQAIAACSK